MSYYAKSLNGHLDVETFCGTSLKLKVFKLDPKKDIRHIVTFYNLRNYPVDIDCDVSLTNPRKTQFNSTLSNDPNTHDAYWTGEIRNPSLGIKVKQDFSHVQLISLLNVIGKQVVNVKIEAEWPQPGKKMTIPLTIDVGV
jgi:hypothetical protein